MIGRWSLLVLLAGSPLMAQETATVRNPNVTISLVAAPALSPGSARRDVVLRFRLAPGWHIYWRNPGPAGIATSIDWRLPAGARMDSLAWPVPEFYDVAGIATHVMHDDVALGTVLTTPAGRRGGTLDARIRYGICKDVCVPGAATLRLDLDARAVSAEWEDAQRILAARRPAAGAGPVLSVEATTGGVLLIVRPTGTAPLSDSLTFYASAREVLPAAVRVAVPRGQREARLLLPTLRQPTRLAGVLVTGPPSRRMPVGWPVDLPVRGKERGTGRDR